MDIIDYLTSLIELEENAAELYLLFSSTIQEDYHFWWKLANEEMNHAALLKTSIEFAKMDELPHISTEDLEEVKELNKMFDNIIGEFKENPNRQKAFEIALEIESSAGESHYQEFMDTPSDNRVVQILQKLNRDDDDHYNRIKEYYAKNIL
jgi:rubrerythrin